MARTEVVGFRQQTAPRLERLGIMDRVPTGRTISPETTVAGSSTTTSKEVAKPRPTEDDLAALKARMDGLEGDGWKLDFYAKKGPTPALRIFDDEVVHFDSVDTETLLPAETTERVKLHRTASRALHGTSLDGEHFATYASAMIDLVGGTHAPKDGIKSATIRNLFTNVPEITLIHTTAEDGSEGSAKIVIKTNTQSIPTLEFQNTAPSDVKPGGALETKRDVQASPAALVEMTDGDNDTSLLLVDSSVTSILRAVQTGYQNRLELPEVSKEAQRPVPTDVFLGMPQKIAA